MNDLLHHPIYARLTAPANPVARHALLHDMELLLARVQRHHPGLAARVHGFVDRGVPYYAPEDAHYREWAARAAKLWDELNERAGAAPVALPCAA